MKTKRLAIMLVFALLIASIPILANVPQGEDFARDRSNNSYIRDGVTIIDDEHPVLTFAVYGYGTIRATNSTNGLLLSGSQVDPGTEITFHTEGLGQEGFEFLGWRINGVPYHGQVNTTLVYTIYADTHVMAVFDHPWAEGPTPPPSSYTLIPVVNVIANAHGNITIRFPGHTPPVEFESFSSDVTTEFRVYPPANSFFDETTILNLNGEIDITFGPVVQWDGRLSFTMLNIAVDNQDVNSSEEPGNVSNSYDDVEATYYENTDLNFVFQVEGGTMPSGTSATQSFAYGSVVNTLPAPTRTGYTFAGWQVNGLFVAPPITVTTDLTFRAVWAPVVAGQFVIGFRPDPGVFPNANESGIRMGTAGTIITDMPQNPTRAGYVFGGWRLPNGNTLSGQMTVVGDMILNAIWTRDPCATPTPAPSSSPSPSSSPRPSSSPAPSSTPGQSGQRPNPQTSPLRISFMIFGVVVMGGIAFFGISKLARKQLAANEQYNSDITRYNREQRIIDMIDKDTE